MFRTLQNILCTPHAINSWIHWDISPWLTRCIWCTYTRGMYMGHGAATGECDHSKIDASLAVQVLWAASTIPMDGLKRRSCQGRMGSGEPGVWKSCGVCGGQKAWDKWYETPLWALREDKWYKTPLWALRDCLILPVVRGRSSVGERMSSPELVTGVWKASQGNPLYTQKQMFSELLSDCACSALAII